MKKLFVSEKRQKSEICHFSSEIYQGCLLGSILLTSLVAVDILGSLLGISKKVLGFFANRWHTCNIEVEIVCLQSYDSCRACEVRHCKNNMIFGYI